MRSVIKIPANGLARLDAVNQRVKLEEPKERHAMKLDILVSFIQAEPQSKAAAQSFQSTLKASAARARATVNWDNDVSEESADDGKPYHVQISGKVPARTQQLSEWVRKVNDNQSEAPPPRAGQKSSWIPPPALTSELTKPTGNFDEFLQKTFENVAKVVAVHRDFDRNRLAKLLL